MVKGISRQVIVVQSPDPKLFDQAIFILRDDVGEGVTDEALMKEAQQVISGSGKLSKRSRLYLYSVAWAAAGAMATGFAWLLTMWI